MKISRCSLRVFQPGNISRPVYVHVGHRRGNIIIYEAGIIVDKIQGAPCNYLRNFAIRSVEVASREINCRAWRSRDKRINSSRNEGGGKNCPPLVYWITAGNSIAALSIAVAVENVTTLPQLLFIILILSNFPTFVIRWRKKEKDLTNFNKSFWIERDVGKIEKKNWECVGAGLRGGEGSVSLAPVVKSCRYFIYQTPRCCTFFHYFREVPSSRGISSEAPIPRKICINFRYPPSPPPPPPRQIRRDKLLQAI